MILDEIKQIQKESKESNCYHVIPLHGLIHKLGCSENGHLKFFITVEDDSSIIKNICAELISVEYDVLCKIIEKDNSEKSQNFTIITLRSNNELLQKTFTDVFLMMLKMIPEKPSKTTIALKVESLISIFAKLKRRPIHKLQGLWAELLLIERSSDPLTVAKSWHNSPMSKYDFTLGESKIEVKSTSSENRVHHFSLDQLNPAKKSVLLICSVILRESGKDSNGLSVFDLYNRISGRIADDEIRLHVYSVMLDTLGSDFYQAEERYFDYSAACDELAFFDSTTVPKIVKSDVPEHVSDVKFCSDLSHLQDVRNSYNTKYNSPLFKSIF